MRRSRAAPWLLLCIAASSSAQAQTRRNGFVLEPATVPVEEILPGGPARDGIPALDSPRHLSAAGAPWREDDVVLGVVSNGEARAYPVAILDWHEVVNDTLGGSPILVTWCPLCGTGMVFDRRVTADAPPRRFGVSGLLYRSDLLLYDTATESLWSQISARALTGPSRGQRLRMLRSRMTRWGEWRAAQPGTTVLARETGHERRYGTSPYEGYALSERLYFPAPRDPRHHPKTPTLGLRLPDGAARAYPATEIARAGGKVEERFEGRRVRIAYDIEAETFSVEAPEPIEVIEGFWFAWMAFHPESSVYAAPRPEQAAPGQAAPRHETGGGIAPAPGP